MPLHQRRAGVLTHTDLVMVMSWPHVRWGFEEGPTRQRRGFDQREECTVLSSLVGFHGGHEGK